MDDSPAQRRREFARGALEKELVHDYSPSRSGVVRQDERGFPRPARGAAAVTVSVPGARG